MSTLGSRATPIDLTIDDDVDDMIDDITCDDLHPPATEITADGDEYFRVERILKVERTGAGVFYYVKWFGYPVSEASWVHETEATDCDDAIAEFRRKHVAATRRWA